MRVYLSGASSELELCEGYRDRLTNIGVEIAHDWMAPIRANASKGMVDRDMSEVERARHANDDLSAVRNADVFWLLVPTTASIGAWVELGHALAHRSIRVISSGRWRSIFNDVAFRFEKHEQAFRWIERKAGTP